MKRKASKPRVVQEPPATYDEAKALLRIVADYAFALDLLDDYDHQRVAVHGATPGAVLYFLIKDHPFVDGNKRIADKALVAMTLLIAESKPADKDLLTRVLVNLISRREP